MRDGCEKVLAGWHWTTAVYGAALANKQNENN